MKIFWRVIWIALGLFFISIALSTIFPGKIKVADNIRMAAQRPLLRWAGKIKVDEIPIIDLGNDTSANVISYKQLLNHINNLKPGTIFFTRTKNYALSEFIPGKWMHTGFILGTKEDFRSYVGRENLPERLDSLMNNYDIYILDSYSGGVSIRPIQELSNMSVESLLTHFASFSFNLPQKQSSAVIKKGMEYMGRDYDYDWITDDDATIFCTELLYYSLKAVGIEIEARTTIVNRDVFTPDNLFEYLMSNSGEGGLFIYNGTISNEVIPTPV